MSNDQQQWQNQLTSSSAIAEKPRCRVDDLAEMQVQCVLQLVFTCYQVTHDCHHEKACNMTVKNEAEVWMFLKNRCTAVVHGVFRCCMKLVVGLLSVCYSFKFSMLGSLLSLCTEGSRTFGFVSDQTAHSACIAEVWRDKLSLCVCHTSCSEVWALYICVWCGYVNHTCSSLMEEVSEQQSTGCSWLEQAGRMTS